MPLEISVFVLAFGREFLVFLGFNCKVIYFMSIYSCSNPVYFSIPAKFREFKTMRKVPKDPEILKIKGFNFPSCF